MFAIVGSVVQAHGAGLDGDTAFTLQLHVIEDLVTHLAADHGTARLQQPVGQRGLAVVNMSNYAEIADMVLWYHEM